MNRRAFVKGLSAAALLPALREPLAALAQGTRPAPAALGGFEPIAATDADDVILPAGFRYDVVLKWGDPFTAAKEPFGYNNDWIGVFPLRDDEEALLAVNHEYVSLAYLGDAALYPTTFETLRGRVPTVDDYKLDVGVSTVRVRRDGTTGAWVPVLSDPLNRRINAHTPCRADGPAARLFGADRALGTFDNCAGQTTPWSTALSCEENFQIRVPEAVDVQGRFTRGGAFDLPGGHYGWVVEIDPYDPGSTPVKHTALGRFRHENVGLRVEAGKPVAAYMGDDRVGGHVWKFVSDGLYRPGDAAGNRALLSSGRLYAARFRPGGRGEWRLLDVSSPLDPNPAPRDPKPAIPRGARRLGDVYFSQGAVLMDAYQAANALGATPSGRPEEVEVHPADGSVFIAFTSWLGRRGLWRNTFGEVWRIQEDRGDAGATRFRWERFAVGGPADPERAGRAFVQPDNMVFDRRGGLWLATDIPSEKVNEKEYRVFKNAGLFHLAVEGSERGHPRQFASLPCEAEATGPAFAPGEQALFLSVQHPGERHGIRRDAAQSPRGSNWPHRRPGAPPQPAVVAIRRS
jgi:secreted PhoX family phosphatase